MVLLDLRDGSRGERGRFRHPRVIGTTRISETTDTRLTNQTPLLIHTCDSISNIAEVLKMPFTPIPLVQSPAVQQLL